MEFLKAVEQAARQGVSMEDFLPLWRSEMTLRQYKEESRLLELKLKLMEKSKGTTPDIPQGLDSLIQQQFQHQQEQLSQMKSDLLTYQQAVLQILGDISALLNSVITQNKYDVFENHTRNWADTEAMGDTDHDWQSTATGASLLEYHSIDNCEVSQNGPQSSSQNGPQSSASENPGIPMSENSEWTTATVSKSGVEFRVKDVSSLLVAGTEKISRGYSPPLCPCVFYLSVTFNEREEIVFHLLVRRASGLNGLQPWQPVTINGLGCIKNKCQGYSKIWEIPNETGKKLNKLKPAQEVRIAPDVCLKTGTGKFEPVSFNLLEARNYILDDQIVIKWNVDVSVAETAAEGQQ